MKTKHFLKLTFSLIGAFLFVAANAFVAQASSLYQDTDTKEDVQIEGILVSFDDQAGILDIEVQTETGEIVLYTIQMPEDFDFTTLTVGDTVDVTSLLNEEGSELLSGPEDELTEEGGGFYCENLDVPHPTGNSLAETYGVTYEEVMEWFCGSGTSEGEDEEPESGEESGHKVGFGQIMLALHTAESSGESVDELLSRRAAGEGWGQIWQDLADQEDQDAGAGDSENSDTEPGNSNKPDDAGPKTDKGKDKDKENNGKGKGKGNNK